MNYINKFQRNIDESYSENGHTIYTHPEENTSRLDKIGKLLDKMSAIIDRDNEIAELNHLYQQAEDAITDGIKVYGGKNWTIATNNLLTIKQIAEKAIKDKYNK